MTRYLALLALIPVVSILASGCGGPDRSALAKQRVVAYWTAIDHGKFASAYNMLSSGDRQSRDFGSYVSDMRGFLAQVAGLSVKTGKTTVSDDTAVVAVTLHSPLTSVPKHAYQHLYWNGNEWQITDLDGGLSDKP